MRYAGEEIEVRNEHGQALANVEEADTDECWVRVAAEPPLGPGRGPSQRDRGPVLPGFTICHKGEEVYRGSLELKAVPS